MHRLLILAVAACRFPAAAAAEGCPPDYDLLHAGQCLRVLATHVEGEFGADIERMQNWAERECAIDDALLPIIKSQEDNDFLRNFTLSMGDYYIIFGARCNEQTRRLEWMDGSPIKYSAEWNDPFALINTNVYSGDCLDLILKGVYYDIPERYWNPIYQKGFVDNANFNLYCMKPLEKTQLSEKCFDFQPGLAGGDLSCLQLSTAKANWTTANNYCKSQSSNLVSVHSKESNDYVRRLAVSHGLLDGLHIGARINQSTAEWMDGSAMDYSNFHSGYPNPIYGDCTAMETNNVVGQWFNMQCDIELPYLCSRGESQRAPACGAQTYQEGEMIFAPGYPFPDEKCDYTLTAAVGKRVQLKIVLLEANRCCDFLVLSEGQNMIAKLTGYDDTGKTYTTTSSNVMNVSWKPNGAKNVRGFKMVFTSV